MKIFTTLQQNTETYTAIKWASSRENLSSGFPTKRVTDQSPQLQRLARKFKIHLKQVYV